LRDFLLPPRLALRAFGLSLLFTPHFFLSLFQVHASILERSRAVWEASPIRERADPYAHACAGVGLSCDLDSPTNLSYLNFMARSPRGVTTTEYALILGVVAVLMYGTYLVLGSSVTSLANGIDSTLTAASRGAAAAEATPKP
jgi:Flp pilus assembly pilin Flp